jgi:hypothetical protein
MDSSCRSTLAWWSVRHSHFVVCSVLDADSIAVQRFFGFAHYVGFDLPHNAMEGKGTVLFLANIISVSIHETQIRS